MAPFITIARKTSDADFARFQCDHLHFSLSFTCAGTVRLSKATEFGAVFRVRNIGLDEAADILRNWDEDCNEGDATLVSIDDEAVRSLM